MPSVRPRRSWILPLAVVLAVVAAVGAWGLPKVWSPAADEPDFGERRSGEPVLELESLPDVRPPEVTMDYGAGTGDELIFLSPRASSLNEAPGHQQGTLIVDSDGRTVWWRAPPGGHPATDFRVQRYRGKPVLTWWEGAMPERGSGSGSGVIMDRSYRHVATVRAGNGFDQDLHEFKLTPRGTAYITSFARTRYDLSDLGGDENALVTQGVVQEIDVETGEVLFEWQSIDHVDPAESYRERPDSGEQSWDYFHINSIDEDGDGDLVVSARHMSAVYKIDKDTGDVVWRLGGKNSSFEMGPGTRFGAQHDARFDGGGDRIRIFDNVAEEDAASEPSNVKVLALDTDAMRATLVDRLDQPYGLWAESQANAQRLPDGGTFVGWGSLGRFSRFDADGRHVLSGHLAQGYDSYRAYTFDWRGAPRGRPQVAATAGDGELTAYAAWNGATEVDRWQVLAGPRPSRLRPAGAPAEWDGVETAVTVAAPGPFVAVRALDARGRPLGRSAVVRAGSG